MRRISLALLLALAGVGCDDSSTPVETPDAGPAATTLQTGAPVSFAPVYDAVDYREGRLTRMWLPVDLSVHPNGELWLVQRMERDPTFDDESECTSRGLAGNPNDCVAQQGSTVAIRDPRAAEPASAENGRANLVVDANSWHFMRRPAGIAFGAPALPFGPDDPGAADAEVTEDLVFTDTFATCHEHATGNQTDGAPFIGPTLWTADPAIYNGVNGTFDWSNGSHLDMVHATQYCVGIAYERDNVYWLFNGEQGTLDRYDFLAPHYPGHSDHDDGDVTRFLLPEGEELVRMPFVPSNLEVKDNFLYVADTGRGRVLRFDIDSPVEQTGSFRTYERLAAAIMSGIAYEVVADSAELSALWGGGEAQPSGLALLSDGTLLVASHATGHISLFDTNGEAIRTIDTGTGAGLGGMTVIDDVVYFVQMNQRRVVRIDVTPES